MADCIVCIILPNFIQIGISVAEILQFFKMAAVCHVVHIGTKHVNRFHYDFLLAQYLNCSKMADGHFFHIAKCHFGGHL